MNPNNLSPKDKATKWKESAKLRLKIRRLNESLRNYESLAKNGPTQLGRQIGKEGAEKIITELNAIKSKENEKI